MQSTLTENTYYLLQNGLALYSAHQFSTDYITDEDFLTFIELCSNPTNNIADYTYIFPYRGWLHECWCPGSEAHCRISTDNLRGLYEQKILEIAKQYNPQTHLNLLSLGSGGLFQDLVILLRLHFLGYHDINLDCIEINQDKYVNQRNILDAIVRRMNLTFHTCITVRHFQKIEELPTDTPNYHAVYAIDFEELGPIFTLDCSSRQLADRSITPEGEALIFLLIKSLSMLVLQHSLFLASWGRNSITISNEKCETQFEEERRIEACGLTPQPKEYDYFYIMTNILALIAHLPSLKTQNKKIFINQKLVPPNIKGMLRIILDTHRIPYEIASEESVIRLITSGKTLIIDDVAYDETLNEDWIDAKFHGLDVDALRLNWKNKKFEIHSTSPRDPSPTSSQTVSPTTPSTARLSYHVENRTSNNNGFFTIQLACASALLCVGLTLGTLGFIHFGYTINPISSNILIGTIAALTVISSIGFFAGNEQNSSPNNARLGCSI